VIRIVAVLAAVTVVHVGTHGTIGPLQIDRSTRADVVAFMGHPQVEVRMYGYFEKRDPLDALGYHCGRDYGAAATKLGATRCLDVFWIDARTGKLGNAMLMDRRFVGPYGIRVGTPSPTAERLLQERLVSGCTEALHKGSITFLFAGGRVVPTSTGNHVLGAHVEALVVDGHEQTGLFECI
jgi:hypothetical protein